AEGRSGGGIPSTPKLLRNGTKAVATAVCGRKASNRVSENCLAVHKYGWSRMRRKRSVRAGTPPSDSAKDPAVVKIWVSENMSSRFVALVLTPTFLLLLPNVALSWLTTTSTGTGTKSASGSKKTSSSKAKGSRSTKHRSAKSSYQAHPTADRYREIQ